MVHDERKERAEGCETTGSDGKALFDSGPNSNIECVPLIMSARGNVNIDAIHLHKKSGELSFGRKGRRAMTAALATQPIVRSGMRAIFVLLFSCRFHTRKAGSKAKVKSAIMLKTLYTKPRAMMTVLLMQVPFSKLFAQKYLTGLHWKSVTKKKAVQAKVDTNMAK